MKKQFLPIVFTLCLTVGLNAQTPPIHVQVGATGGGTSWADACNLDSAIALAAKIPNAQIWMQAGTYYTEKTFFVSSRTQIYGGFAGDETLLSQRNYASRQTLIDAQKYCAVIHLKPQAMLNGLTIQNGLANSPAQANGGGVFMEANASVENCYILNNIALDYGGGIYAEGDGHVFNTVIAYNKAGKDGAAVYGTTLNVLNATVAENELMLCSENDDTIFMDTLCAGHSISLTIWDQGTYLWNTGETSATILTAALTSDAVYSCIITKPDRSCTFVMNFAIAVKPMPTLQITTHTDTANVGESCVFTAVAEPSGGTYLWDDSTTNSTLTQAMPNTGNLQYHCTYTLNGCTAKSYATIINTECSAPTKPDSVVADYATVCASDEVTLKLHGGVLNSGRWMLYAGTCGGTLLDSSNIAKNQEFKVNPSETTTYYIRGEGCEEETACVAVTVTVNPRPAEITGDSSLCANSSASYSNSSTGGSWSTLSPYFSVNTEGLVTGLSAGSGNLIYTLPNGCSTTKSITVKETPTPILGETTLCQGSSYTYTSTPNNGIWAWQTPTSIAVLDAKNGVVSGVYTGSAVLTYQHPSSGCIVTKQLSVDSLPVKTDGMREVCQFDSILLTNATSGGVWQVSPAANASIGANGMLSGLLPGTALVSYRLRNCADTFHVRVNPGVPWVTVASQLCEGSTIQATCPSVPGGIWTTPQPDTAEVDPNTGYIKGLQPGSFKLTYTLPNGGCSRTFGDIYVNPLPDTIAGEHALGLGYSATLTSASSDGVWMSNNPAIANINPKTGVVTGVSEGQATIRYELLATGCRDTFSIQVNPCAVLTPISEVSTFDQTVCYNYDETDNFSFKPVVVSATNVSETSIAWYNDVKPSGLVYDSLNYTLSGIPKQSGEFVYAIYAVNQKAGCPYAFISGRLLVFDSLKGGTIDTNQSVCYGSRIEEFSSKEAGSGGSPVSSVYAWEMSLNGTDFTPISTTSANQLTYNEVDPILESRYYRRRYTNSCGSVWSNVAIITMNPLPAKPTGTTLPDTTCTEEDPSGIIIINVDVKGYAYSVDGSDFIPVEPEEGNLGFSSYSQGIYTMYQKDTLTGCINSDTISIYSREVTPAISGFLVKLMSGDTIDGMICSRENEQGHTFSITPIDDEAGQAYSYKWDDNSEDKTRIIPVPETATEYTVTVTHPNTCFSIAKKTITIMHPIEIASNTADQHYCYGDIYAPLSVNVTIPAGNITSMSDITYQWFRTSGSNDPEAIAGATNSSYLVPNNMASDWLYHVEVNPHNGVCAPAKSPAVKVTIEDLPVISSVVHDTSCGAGRLELSATTNASQVNWYASEHGGTVIATTLSGNVFTTDSISTTTTYWAEAVNGSCVSYGRMPVTATVLTPHALVQTSPASTLLQSVCSGTSIDAISFSIGGGATGGMVLWSSDGTTWSSQAPSGIVASPISIYGITANNSHLNDSTYTWMLTTSGNMCKKDTAKGSITIHHLPDATVVNADAQGCDSVVLTAVNGEGGKIFYQGITGLDTNRTRPDTIQTVTASGTYFFRAVSPNGCWGLQGSRSVTIYNHPEIIQQLDTTNYMATPSTPFQSLIVTASGSEPLLYQWYSSTKAIPDASSVMLLTDSISNTYTPDNSEPAIGSALYFFCVVSNNAACPPDTSFISGLYQVVPEISGCDNVIPGWGNAGLGTVTFVSGQTWVVGSQTWSDAVTATNCQKGTYKGIQANSNANSADCRNNPKLIGDLFSWCAVVQYAHQICPDGWRVPTKTDFINLDLALGGTGNENNGNVNLLNIYLNPTRWGGLYAGYCDNSGRMWNVDDRAYYWSSTQSGASNGYNLHFNDAENVYARKVNQKCNGFMVRCVK